MPLDKSWSSLLEAQRKKPYFVQLMNFINSQYMSETVFPPREQLFAAFEATPYEEVKVVIIGQDPYHKRLQSNGLCFSVNEGVPIPPSLRNIFKELKMEYGDYPRTTDLHYLASQGVLLTNTVLTVVEGCPNSHKNKGWEIFTNSIIELLNEKDSTIVFLLWGNEAKAKKVLITNEKHSILTAAHPSPLSARRGFLGCNHFKLANEILVKSGKKEIKWI